MLMRVARGLTIRLVVLETKVDARLEVNPETLEDVLLVLGRLDVILEMIDPLEEQTASTQPASTGRKPTENRG